MILHYIITAWRCIWKYKTQNLISVLGLSVALLCFSICLYCTRYIYSIDENFEKRERIAEFGLSEKEGGRVAGVPTNLLQQVKPHMESDVEAFVAVSYARERDYNVEVGVKQLPYTLLVMEVDTTYHTVFTPEVVSGSWQVASNTPNAIVLSESKAKKIFGDVHQAIGKQMTLTQRLFSSPESTPRNGGISYTIQAVIKNLPANNSMQFMSDVDAWAMNDSEGMLREGRIRDMDDNDLLKIHMMDSAQQIEANTSAHSRKKLVKISKYAHVDGVAAILDAMCMRQNHWAEMGKRLMNEGK